MGGYNRNGEGYMDKTAWNAINHSNKPKRDKVEEKARKIRAMGNEDMVAYIENRVAKARSEGYNEGRRVAIVEGVPDYDKSIKTLRRIKGIGEKMARDIMVALYG